MGPCELSFEQKDSIALTSQKASLSRKEEKEMMEDKKPRFKR